MTPGRLAIGAEESHHLRDVLRLGVGTEIEAFDAAGRSAVATIVELGGPSAIIDVGPLQALIAGPEVDLTIAAAVPKGERADWMVEKLCELGVTTFIPLESARSIVLPTGKAKAERWHRIAIEAAKQSRRSGVMTIAPLTKVVDVLNHPGEKRVASTGAMTRPLVECLTLEPVTIFIGPEGGWTNAELSQFDGAGVTQVSLTRTVLRIETAAVTAAALMLGSGVFSTKS